MIYLSFLVYFLSFYLGEFEHSKKNPLPPGTVQVTENFYLDQNEIAVIDYKEYLYWLKRVHSEDAETYVRALPDTSVLKADFPLGMDYFKNPKYNNFPMVGVSWEQAIGYTNWRTDRVCEVYLIEKGLIGFNPEATPENAFTYSKYINGNYFDAVPPAKIKLPIYELPSQKDWEQKIEDIISDASIKKKKKSKQNVNGLYIIKYKRNKKINHLTKNLSEMLAEQGIAIGGNWTLKNTDDFNLKTIPYTKPTNWLGFRNKCSYKTFKTR